jgi:dihydrofolate reductase
MRKLVVTENSTADGVIDMSGGWFDPLAEDTDQADITAATAKHSAAADALLVGRNTFESFRGFWPNVADDPTGVRDYLNAVDKYVVSQTIDDPQWQNSTVLRGSIADEVTALKEADGRDIVATGSIPPGPETAAVASRTTRSGCSFSRWSWGAVHVCSTLLRRCDSTCWRRARSSRVRCCCDTRCADTRPAATKLHRGRSDAAWNVNARCRDLGRRDQGVQDSSSHVVGIAEGRAQALGEATMFDAALIQPLLPRLEFVSVRLPASSCPRDDGEIESQRPRQLGSRLATKASTPSRKSSLP